MIIEVSSHQGIFKMPSTSVHQLLDDNLIIFLRSWGSQDYDHKFIEEIMHFLSTAQADIEVTSPFDYLENLTPLANKVRISLLLAHDYFYKIENKSSLSVGFETAILMKVKNEISWAAVGRFDLFKQTEADLQMLSASGTDKDQVLLLPVDLVGVEKDFDMRCGSLLVTDQPLIVSSTFKNNLKFNQDDKSEESTVYLTDPNGTYWFSKIKSE